MRHGLAFSSLALAFAVSAGPALAEAPAEPGLTMDQCKAILNPPCACDGSCAPQPPRPVPIIITEDDLSRLDPVEVWGDRPASAPGARSVIEAGDIRAFAADRPADILNTLPGVNIQMNSGQEHLIAIRSPVLTGGAGQGSFLILENGVPTRSPAFGNVNSLIEPHHELAAAIEVVRGPGSAKVGSNAVHGLINVILAEPRGQSEARVSYGSLGRWRVDGVVDTGALRIAVSVMDDAGWRDDTGSDQQKLSVTGAFGAGDWALVPWLSASNLAQETAGFIQGPDAYRDRSLAKTNPDPEAFRDAWSARIGLKAERSLGPGKLTLLPYAHSQAMIFSQHFLPNGGIEKNGHTGGGIIARYEWPATDGLALRAGTDVDVARGYLREVQPEPFGFFPGDRRFPQGLHYDYSVLTAMGAIWSEAEWQASERLSLLAGLRIEEHDFDYTTRAPVGINGRFNVVAGRTDHFDIVTPKLGAVWRATDSIDLYTNYARGARPPQVSDLYRLQNLQRAGEIETETADSFEIGLRGEALGGRAGFDLAAYLLEKDGFFFRDSDGLNVVDGSTRHAGVEASGNLGLTNALALSGNVAWSEQTYTFDRPVMALQERIVSGNVIDTAPEWLADARLDWAATETLTLSLTAEHVGEYFTDPANTATYPGHTVLGARAAWNILPSLEAYMIVRNLTDAAYADRADIAFGNPRFFPGEPRHVTVGLSRTF